MDETAARDAFENALSTCQPDFETFFLSRLFGLSFSYTDDSCRIEFPVHDFMFNPQGTLHGGVTAFVLDVAMGHLLKRSTGVPGATLEMKVQYLAPLRPPRATCEGRFLRQGKSLSFLEARIWDAEGTRAAVATSTWALPKAKPADKD